MIEYRAGTTLGVVKTLDELGPGWQDIVEKSGEELNYAIYIEYNLLEEVICFLAYKNATYDVGVGEALRPYNSLYSGDDIELATRAFLEAVQDHTW